MGVLAVEGAAGQRLIEILKPVGADKVGIVGDGAEVAGIGRAAFALSADPDQSLPEQPAIDRAEMELADQGRFAECVELCPFGGIIGDRAPIAIEAEDIAPAGAGLDRLRGLPGETAAEIEVVGIMAVQGFCHGSKVSFGKSSAERRQIADDGRIPKGRGRWLEPATAEHIPRRNWYAPGLPKAFGLPVGLDEISHKDRLRRALRSGGKSMDGKSVIVLWVC